MSSLSGPSEFARSSRPGDLTSHLRQLLQGKTLSESESRSAFEAMMSGDAHHAEMGALLALLATRLPTVDELVGAARVMRERVTPVPTTLDPASILDTAGTGGAPKTFNVSTTAAIVAAAGGARVAKHGNRSRTGRGSAETLERLGVCIDAPPTVLAKTLDEVGICFCFAVHHHPAAKFAMPVRKALGFPTIFNVLGPLTNPARAQRQIMGVYDRRFVRPAAEALQRLGAVRALVMHSGDGLDEFSIGAPTHVADITTTSIREYEVDATTLGLRSAAPTELAPQSLEAAAQLMEALLRGDERGPARDMTLLSTAAALIAGGIVLDFAEGVRVAAHTIDFGDAWNTFERMREMSRATA
ncbi:MAG: anthranilate phosphoribosyltransferase [Phycisphaerae bacterium]|mgnify:CR=1 FL=1|nr:anthranilate phosphoribosyltransferase [Phycisphaerae bacterium]